MQYTILQLRSLKVRHRAVVVPASLSRGKVQFVTIGQICHGHGLLSEAAICCNTIMVSIHNVDSALNIQNAHFCGGKNKCLVMKQMEKNIWNLNGFLCYTLVWKYAVDRNLKMCSRQYCKIINLFTFKISVLLLSQNIKMRQNTSIGSNKMYQQIFLTWPSCFFKGIIQYRNTVLHYKNRTLEIGTGVLDGTNQQYNHLISHTTYYFIRQYACGYLT